MVVFNLKTSSQYTIKLCEIKLLNLNITRVEEDSFDIYGSNGRSEILGITFSPKSQAFTQQILIKNSGLQFTKVVAFEDCLVAGDIKGSLHLFFRKHGGENIQKVKSHPDCITNLAREQNKVLSLSKSSFIHVYVLLNNPLPSLQLV